MEEEGECKNTKPSYIFSENKDGRPALTTNQKGEGLNIEGGPDSPICQKVIKL